MVETSLSLSRDGRRAAQAEAVCTSTLIIPEGSRLTGGSGGSTSTHRAIALTVLNVQSRLIAWESAPLARAAHPQEDHLIPLMTVVGAAENEPGAVVYHQQDLFGGITASSFRFGDPV